MIGIQTDKGVENIKKGVDLVTKTITLQLHHTFWYFFLPTLCADYHVKLHNFTFEGGRQKTRTNFPSSFSVRIRLQENSPKIKKI